MENIEDAIVKDKTEKKYVIRVENSGGNDMAAGISCKGYLLLAFEIDHEGTEEDCQLAMENLSIANIKRAIKSSSELMQAACLAVGEQMADNFGREIRIRQSLGDMTKSLELLKNLK